MADLTEMIEKWKDKAVDLREAEKLIDLLILENETLSKHEDSVTKIVQWCKAYPVKMFPEPDLKKAAKVLKENDMTLDAISASNFRFLLGRIQEIINE